MSMRWQRLCRRGAKAGAGGLTQLRQDSGQSLLIVTIALFVIAGVAAFALNLAELAAAHHRAQLAADAGALAAAQDMSTTGVPTTTVQRDGTTAASSNYPSSTITISEPSGVQAKAQVSAPVNLPFGSMFGLSSGSVSAQAVAQVDRTTANVNGTILSVGCGNTSTTNCTYTAGQAVPTGSVNTVTGWYVTSNAETPTTNHQGGETTVNLQTCQGSQGNGQCYAPGSTTPVPSNNLTEVVDLNGQTEGGIWQTVTTVPGADYVLNFWLTGNPALNGWPYPSSNQFPVDVWITNGANTQYTPRISADNWSPSYDVCSGSKPSDYIACGWWDYRDEVISGQEEANFTVESISFTAQSTSTTITFNSGVYDNNQADGSRYWFYCGPELANITLGFPAIRLAQ